PSYSDFLTLLMIPYITHTFSLLTTFFFFFFNDTATTEIYTLSLHDALPISELRGHSRTHTTNRGQGAAQIAASVQVAEVAGDLEDRKSTRLNSSHVAISYAVFCLKKKKVVVSVVDAKIVDKKLHPLLVVAMG